MAYVEPGPHTHISHHRVRPPEVEGIRHYAVADGREVDGTHDGKAEHTSLNPNSGLRSFGQQPNSWAWGTRAGERCAVGVARGTGYGVRLVLQLTAVAGFTVDHTVHGSLFTIHIPHRS